MEKDNTFQNIDLWEKLLNSMSANYKKSLKREEDWLINTVKKNSSVLEIGCGDGRSLKQLLKVTENITGIDHDKMAIKSAKEKLKSCKQVKLLVQSAKKINFFRQLF